MEIRPPKTCGFYTETQVEIAKRAAQILSDDLRQHIPVRQIAERFSVSETSLKNYFRGVYGQNISTWLREIRMNEAARLLSDTKRPIAEISEQVGYSNQGKFAAVFKKAVWSFSAGIPAVKEFGKPIRTKPGFATCQQNPGLSYA